MNKKLGINIIIGIIIFVVVIAIAGVIYVGVNKVYGASKSDIADVSFVKSQLVIDLDADNDPREGICPIIELDDGTVYDPEANYYEVINDPNYQYYVSQIEITSRNANSTMGTEKTTKVLDINGREKDRFVITAIKTGKCSLGIRVKGDSKDDDTMTVIVKDKNNPNPGQVVEEEEDEDEDSYSNISLELGQEADKYVTYNGKTQIIYLNILTEGISKKNLEKVKWHSSNEDVATVEWYNTANGKVTLKKPGTAKITVTYGDLSDSCNVIVYSKDLQVFNSDNGKNISEQEITLNVGEKMKIYLEHDEEKLDSSEIKFSSSREKYCSIDEDGNIEALKASSGKVIIRGKLASDTKCDAVFYIKVIDKKADALSSGTFSFVTDQETGEIKKYTGKNGFVVGETYTVNFVKPEGLEDEKVELTVVNTSKTSEYIDFWTEEDNGVTVTKLKALKSTDGKKLTFKAKMTVNNKSKTTSTKIQIFNTMAEKEEAGGSEIPYIEIDYGSEQRMAEIGNSFTLKPTVDTNISKQGYTITYTSSDENVATINKNGKVTPLKVGTTVITATAVNKNNESINSTTKITLEVKEEVVLVSKLTLSEKTESGLTKKSSKYQLEKGKVYTFEFDVSPENATIKEYSLEVDDKENFLVEDNTITPLVENKDAVITATAMDTSGKKKTIKIHSVLSEEEISSLQSIEEIDEINISVGETVTYQKEAETKISKNLQSKATLTNTDNSVIITGKKEGTGSITLTINNERKKVPVNVNLGSTTSEDEVLVQDISFPIDPETNKTKDYVNTYPLQVGKNYSFGLTILPENATNKDVVYKVSNSSFTVTENGIIANKANANATLTVTSVSNPKVSASVKIASIDNNIQSIAFAKEYTGENKFDITKHEIYNCDLIITLVDGYVYDPRNQDLSNNNDYQKLLKQIKLVSDNEDILTTNKNKVSLVKGASGSGTLTAQVIYDSTISATTRYEAVGVDSNVTIKKVEFIENSNKLEKYAKLGVSPKITLSNGRVLKPTKTNNVVKTTEYQYYLNQLELAKIESDDSTGILSTGRLLKNFSKGEGVLTAEAGEWTGKCKLGISLNGEIVAETIINVVEPEEVQESINVNVEEIDHSLTTTNKNLDITKIQFVENSYTLDGSYGYVMNPILTLSDGTELDPRNFDKGLDKEIYYYYCGLTEIYLTTKGNSSSIDFGVLEVQNRNTTAEQPKYVIPLKNGTVELGIGLENDSYTYDTTTIKVDLD